MKLRNSEGLINFRYHFNVLIDFTASCDFESTCSWTNAQTGDQFDWLQGKGGTTSRLTGPSNDHTLGNSAGNAKNNLETVKNILKFPKKNFFLGIILKLMLRITTLDSFCLI